MACYDGDGCATWAVNVLHWRWRVTFAMAMSMRLAMQLLLLSLVAAVCMTRRRNHQWHLLDRYQAPHLCEASTRSSCSKPCRSRLQTRKFALPTSAHSITCAQGICHTAWKGCFLCICMSPGLPVHNHHNAWKGCFLMAFNCFNSQILTEAAATQQLVSAWRKVVQWITKGGKESWVQHVSDCVCM